MNALRLITMVILVSATALWAEEELLLPQSGDSLRIHVEGLLRANPDQPGRTLMLEFNRLGGHWFMGGGRAPSYNQGNHYAVLTQGDGEDLSRLSVQARVAGDAWVRGGEVDIHIEWESSDGSNYSGSYNGIALGEEVSGSVSGIYQPAMEAFPQHRPVMRGEHPRLIVRQDDLPALREKAQSEWGQRDG